MANFEEIVKKHAGSDVPETAISAIVSAIKTAVGNEYVEKERYKAKLTELDALKEKHQTVEDNAMTAEKWKTKYESVKSDFEEYKKQQLAKDARAAKQAAYRELLKEAKVSEKRFDAILKVSDVDSFELEQNGKLKDEKKLLEGIKTEWADFIVTDAVIGASTPSPQASASGVGKKTKDEILAIKDVEERQKAIAENHELFGF